MNPTVFNSYGTFTVETQPQSKVVQFSNGQATYVSFVVSYEWLWVTDNGPRQMKDYFQVEVNKKAGEICAGLTPGTVFTANASLRGSLGRNGDRAFMKLSLGKIQIVGGSQVPRQPIQPQPQQPMYSQQPIQPQPQQPVQQAYIPQPTQPQATVPPTKIATPGTMIPSVPAMTSGQKIEELAQALNAEQVEEAMV